MASSASRDARAPARRSSVALREQLLDQALRVLVRALADVLEADGPGPIDENGSGPRPDPVALPDGVVVVLDDRIPHAQTLGRSRDVVARALPRKLRAVHAHDGQSLRRVSLVPGPQLRDHVLAVDSAVRPELDEDDPPPQSLHRERAAVQPWSPGELGRGLTGAQGLS